jgi:hypothetical protein
MQRIFPKEIIMKRQVGLWIDHHKTVMVTMIDEKEETREVRSNVEKYAKLAPGNHAMAPNISSMSHAEDVVDRRYMNHLSEYYDGVISLLRNADSIWIFGPGEAKVELKNRLEREAPGERMVIVESGDKMTDRQIVAKVRQHYRL